MPTKDPRTKYPKPGKKERPQRYPGSESDMVTKPDYGRDSYEGSGRLAGKAALITGGDSGIGRAVALAFAREGADVAIAYMTSESEDAEETLALIEECGQRAVGAPGDLRDAAYCADLIPQVSDELGKLDILVNNAGLQKHFKGLDDISQQDFLDIYQVNVVASFLLSQAAAKKMRPGSSIINTVSIEAYDPDAILLPYAASKGAFVALTKALAEELLEKGIRGVTGGQGIA